MFLRTRGMWLCLVAPGLLVACAGAPTSSDGGVEDAGVIATGGGAATAGGAGGGSSMAGGAGGGSATGGGTGGGVAGGTGGGSAGGSGGGAGGGAGASPMLGGCPVLPSNHIFNTPIDSFPVHPNSAAFMTTIGSANVHLDLGTSEDQTANDYYGIPYNLIDASALTWSTIAYTTTHAGYTWDPREESDCAVGAGHTLVSPCTAAAAPMPQVPIPASPLVEGGILADSASTDDGDHHMLMLDTSSCRLWELYHAYTGAGGTWHVFGSATFDLRSNALRPATWTSADAAGFPILPLLLRAAEASSGTINHAVRFTIPSGSIRNVYTWPGRHKTGNATSMARPPMGQLFRLKASYVIPANYTTQAKAILRALQVYGMYLADGGSAMFIQGEPSAAWQSATISQVQSVSSANFEAVDLSPIASRAGFDEDSGAVPPP